MPHVLDMPKPIADEKVAEYLQAFFRDVPTRQLLEDLSAAFELMQNADSLGSIMKFEMAESTTYSIIKTLAYWQSQQIVPKEVSEVLPLLELIIALSAKYSTLVMNPPYMGSGSMNNILSNYARTNYEEGKADLFSIFMILAIDKLGENGKYAMINMHSWMFLSSFEKLRKDILDNYQIDSLLHLGARTFDELSGEVVQNAAFVITKRNSNKKGTYYRLIDGRNCSEKKLLFSEAKNNNNIFFPNVEQKNFKKIPGCPIGYWLSDKIIKVFVEEESLEDIANPRKGLVTCDDNRFLRMWFEIGQNDFLKPGFNKEEALSINKKWVVCNKGGGSRKWYGLNHYVINWLDNGRELKDFIVSKYNGGSYTKEIRSENYYFQEGITWSGMTSGNPTFRLFEKGCVFSSSGPSAFPEEHKEYIIGLLNSEVSVTIFKLLSPTLSVLSGDIAKVPVKFDKTEIITEIVNKIFSISKLDWNVHETSWDFKTNELVGINENNFLDIINDYADFNEICIDPAAPEPESIEWRMNMYEMKWETNFYRLKQNEEELNRQFIEIYGLQDELEEFVPTSDITILQQGEITITPAPGDDSGYGDTFIWNVDVIIKLLISYAVGCWMGRYRLDKPGLHIAHPNPTDEEICTYKYGDSQLTIDDDGIIPILPTECGFDDNLMKRVQEFIRIAFGREKVNQNISYVEACLGTTIEKYLIKDFWKDHKKMYQNRPIYWLFSSKKGAFQCLVYMHRMNANTADRVRCNYLMPHMDWLRQQIAGYTANAVALNTTERNRLKKLRSDLEECEEYNDRLQLVADHRIAFDLDDGVVVNYAKFGDVLAKIK